MSPTRFEGKKFPFLFGRAFIEADVDKNVVKPYMLPFPFLFGRAFIEASRNVHRQIHRRNFPSFSEGLSLRDHVGIIRIAHDLNFPTFS